MIHVRCHSSFQILIEALTCKVILLNMAYSTRLQTDVTLVILSGVLLMYISVPPSLILCFPCCITFFSSTLLLLLIQLLNIIYAHYCILRCGHISFGASCKLNYISYLSQSFHKWKWLLSRERQLKVTYLLLLK